MIRNLGWIFGTLFFSSLLSAPSSFTWANSPKAEIIKRKILALYESKIHADPFYSLPHRSAEMPLNYLGLEVIHHPVEKPFPSLDEMKNYRGVLAWFSNLNAVADPKTYCSWLIDQMENGRFVVILDEPGIFKDKLRQMDPVCLETFRTLGLEYKGNFADNPYFFEVTSKDPEMVEFERKIIFTEEFIYTHYQSLSDQNHVSLSVKRTDVLNSESAMVVTTPKGGFAHTSFVHYENKPYEKNHWRLNPFLFFEEAFQVKGLPRPDATTINGRRIFFSQIDGDGIFNISHIDQESFSGEIILDKILKKYSDLPISVSIITGYLDYPEYKSPRVTELYRKIFELPNVEATNHGYAHPLVWKTGKVALDIPGYQYSAEKEISGSIALQRELLKSINIDKPVALFQWTGDCVPQDLDIALTTQMPILNLNGGGSLFDGKSDSYSFVYPLGILKGSQRQIYAGAGNENDFTNLWHGPYFGFSRVLETFAKTEKPRLVKPVDIYYHFYSGERMASLEALKEVYNTVLSQSIFPVFTSEYAQIANDFFKTTLFTLKTGDKIEGYRVENEGTLKTIRFDNEARNVDLKRSRGVLGFQHKEKNLYLFLNDQSVHDIYLTSEKPSIPFLMNASFFVSSFKGDERQIHFLKKGWSKSEACLGGVIPQRKYRIEAGEEIFNETSGLDGTLNLVFGSSEKNGPATPVTITLEPL